jgi:thioredoxin-dependent peroxiredoxin
MIPPTTNRARGAAALLAAALATSLAGAPVEAQPSVTPLPAGPAVGDAAPDFALPGATRYGLLQTPVRLSDYRGETVVLAFFFKARTKG